MRVTCALNGRAENFSKKCRLNRLKISISRRFFRTKRIGGKDSGRKEENNENFNPNLPNFGTEIVIFGTKRQMQLKIALKNLVERLVF